MDFETAPTTEYFPTSLGDESTIPWFPLDEPTEAAREWEQRDNHETAAATPRAKERR